MMDEKSAAAVAGKLIGLFRAHGYDGVSLARIMEETGLVKASLYHRFPRGKEEMGEAAIERVARLFQGEILAPLEQAGDSRERLSETSRRLKNFYASGQKSCLLDTMTLQAQKGEVRARAKATMDYWIDSFASFAKISAPMSGGKARRRAQDAVAAIEGGLVMARVTGNRQAFSRALARLPEWLLQP